MRIIKDVCRFCLVGFPSDGLCSDDSGFSALAGTVAAVASASAILLQLLLRTFYHIAHQKGPG